MKAIVFHGIGDIRLDEVREPKLEEPTDAIVRLTASAICGTDLHMIRGTLPGMRAGTILGHEGVGVVEEVGEQVRNFRPGDRVVIGSTIACGACMPCRLGIFAQCDNANPNGPEAGTAFFGGPADSGPFDGMQAELVRVPFAHVTMVKLPDAVSDDQAILLSDIFPTGYFGAHLTDVQPGQSVAVFGCGPVGQFAIASAKLLGAGRIFAVDCVDDRLEMARAQGAEVVNYDREQPVEALKELTRGLFVDCAIDAVGVDANRAHHGPAAKEAKAHKKENDQEVKKVAPEQNIQGDNWRPGDAPSQALKWAVKSVRKAGQLAIIGVYPLSSETFPIGEAMNKNLTLRMGNCNHRRYIPELVRLVATGAIEPRAILTQTAPLTDALSAYQNFDARRAGWLKVELLPTQH